LPSFSSKRKRRSLVFPFARRKTRREKREKREKEKEKREKRREREKERKREKEKRRKREKKEKKRKRQKGLQNFVRELHEKKKITLKKKEGLIVGDHDKRNCYPP